MNDNEQEPSEALKSLARVARAVEEALDGAAAKMEETSEERMAEFRRDVFPIWYRKLPLDPQLMEAAFQCPEACEAVFQQLITSNDELIRLLEISTKNRKTPV
jgi:hypothetical protein